VVADLTHIIYSVLVKVQESDLCLYSSIVCRVSQSYLSYFLSQDISSNIGLQSNEFGNAVDRHTVKTWRKIQLAFEQNRAEGQMLPPIHDIAPFSVSQWNHVKGGQDVVSRILKNVKVDFRSLTPRAFIIIRFVMISLMNAHMVRRLLLHEDRLDNFSSYTHLKQSLNKEAAFWDFLKMFATEWKPSPRFITHVSDAAQLGLAGDHPIDSVPSAGPIQKAPKRNRFNLLVSQADCSTRLRTDVYHERISLPRKERPICGTQTAVACDVCGLHVCGEKAFGQRRSCWDLLHTSKRLEKRERPPRETGARGRRGRRRSSGGTQAIIEEALPPRQRRRSSQQNVNH